MFKLGLRQALGGRLNSLVVRHPKVIGRLDMYLEMALSRYQAPTNRRYRSFIGNYLISTGKFRIISSLVKKYEKKIYRIVDIGAADGSLLLHLAKGFPNANLLGVDSGYALPPIHFKDLRITMRDLNLYHGYYNPSGENPPEAVDLKLGREVDLCIIYDVIPYLTTKTLANYFRQISAALVPDGLLFATAMLAPEACERDGCGGEKHQQTISSTVLLELAARFDLHVEDLKYGDWGPQKSCATVYGSDIILFKKGAVRK